MQPVIANKGMRTFRCCVRGKEAHSALAPHGVNAIEYAARLVAHIRGIADRMQCERDARPRLPGAVHHAPDRADPRRHRAEHRAAGVRVPLRVPLPAGRRPGCARARDQGLRRGRARAGDASGRSAVGLRVLHQGQDPRARHRRGRQGDGARAGAVPEPRREPRSPTRPRRDSSSRRGSPRSSAGRARSSRRTSRTSSSRSTRSRAARRSSSGWSAN